MTAVDEHAADVQQQADEVLANLFFTPEAVSYTHLTLPTNREV